MTRVVVTDALRSLLPDLSQPLELCDEGGRVLARILPAMDAAQYEDLEPRISREEMRRRKQNKNKTYTTAEVLAHLEKQ